MLSQEEIRIRAGLDYSKVTAGLTDIRSQVFKLANDVPKKLYGLLKANLYVAAGSMIAELLPSWQELWDKVYGVDADTDKRLQDSAKNINTLRKTLEKAKEDLANVWKTSQMNEATPLGKTAILEGDLATAEGERRGAQERLKIAKEHNFSLEERARLETEYIQALTKEFNAAEALKKQQGTLSPQDLESEYKRKLKQTIPQVYRDRVDIRSLQDELAIDPTRSDFREMLAAAQQRIATVTKARGVGSLGALANALPDYEGFAGIKESLLAAQQEAMKNVIQRVSIVEIKE